MKYTDFKVNPMDGYLSVYDGCKVIKRVKLRKFIEEALPRIYGFEKGDRQ